MTSQSVWHRSSYSGSGGDNCVEVATQAQPAVRVRDSKDINRTGLRVSPAAWSAFTNQLTEATGLPTHH